MNLLVVTGELHPIHFWVKDEIMEGQTVSASCVVSHSCPTSPPVFTWSLHGEAKLQSKQLDDGQWTATSTLNFHPTSTDHNKRLQCTVTYKGGQHHNAYRVLKVKRKCVWQWPLWELMLSTLCISLSLTDICIVQAGCIKNSTLFLLLWIFYAQMKT